MAESAERLVSRAMLSLETVDVPETLQDSINQHQRHLLSLAAALLAGGQDEAVVKQAIDGVFSSYKNELVNTIMALKAGGNDF